MPEIENTTIETAAPDQVLEVHNDHVQTAPADFSSQPVKTETQAKRLAHEAEDRASAAASDAKSAARKGKAKAKDAANEGENAVRRAGRKLSDNRDNPVVVGNVVAVVAVAGGLGFGAYQKYSRGQLDWKLAGFWGGVVGVVAVGDYFLSQYLLENKYPSK